MTITRVALLDMKPRLHDILSDAIAGAPELQLVDWEKPQPYPAPVPQPDVLVAEVADPQDPAVVAGLFRTQPNIRLLLISNSGAEAAIHQLRFDRGLMVNIAVDQLLAAIRYGVELGGASQMEH